LLEAGRRLDAEHGAGLRLTADHPFRLADVAYERDGRDLPELERLRRAAVELGVFMIWSSVHVHLTPRPPDKGEGLLRFAADHGLDPATILTIGDAPNDEGLFAPGRFGVTVGTSDVLRERDAFRWLPAYVTTGREADGFLEVARALLAL
jgi:hydroxymethylpyrimidine pyrophosphatase-like HAD family hydrolase